MTKRTNTRAAQGSGTIRQRKNGRWEARYTIGRDAGTGKQIQKSVYGASEKEVLKKLQQIHVDIENGAYTEPTKLTVGAWLGIWLNEYTSHIKQSTKSDYANKSTNHIIPALGSIPIQKLNSHTVQEFYNKLLENGRIKQECHIKETPDGLSARTVKLTHTILHMALNQAVKLNYIKTNPTDACTLPRVVKKDMKILQGSQIPAFLKAVENHYHKALFTTLLFTGMRRGEVLGLTWECVDFSSGTILVKKQLQRERIKGGKLQLVPLKNDRQRLLSPPSTVFKVLAEHRKMQAENQFSMGQVWDYSGLVFTNCTGGALDGDAVYNSFKRMLVKNNLPPIRIHDLRHTTATLMLQNGDDYKTLQGALGHHSAGFTLDTYGHVTEKMKKDSADRMEAFIQSIKMAN
jgi:integrase